MTGLPFIQAWAIFVFTKVTHWQQLLEGLRSVLTCRNFCAGLAQGWPLTQASEQVTELKGVAVNAKQIERLCHHYGELLGQVDWKHAYNEATQLRLPLKDQVTYAMMDGSMILTRQKDESWKEVKLCRTFRDVDRVKDISKDRNLIGHSDYVAHLGKHIKINITSEMVGWLKFHSLPGVSVLNDSIILRSSKVSKQVRPSEPPKAIFETSFPLSSTSRRNFPSGENIVATPFPYLVT